MNGAQQQALASQAQELEMEAGKLGDEAATLEAKARGTRAAQQRLLNKAAELREEVGT